MLKIFGILIILTALGITTYWVIGTHSNKGWAFTICLLATFIGAFLILQERVTELTVDGIGSIKSAVKQASTDANIISELKGRVEAQSATVNLIAKEAADAKELVNNLSEKNLLAEEKLSQLDESIIEGKLSVKKLEQYTKFNTAILSAQTDNRPAYDQLWTWANDGTFQFQKNAAQAAQTIMDQHNPAMVRGGFNVPWNEDVKPLELTLKEIRQSFKNAPPHIRLGILEFVWKNRPDIIKKDKLEFLIEVLSNDESLGVVEYAGRYFQEGTNNKFKPLAISAHLHWWEKNKDSID